VREPILNVSAPDERPVDGDVDVLQVRRVHDLPDVICAFREDDAAILPAFLERRGFGECRLLRSLFRVV
jgi:hypothetical protein